MKLNTKLKILVQEKTDQRKFILMKAIIKDNAHTELPLLHGKV